MEDGIAPTDSRLRPDQRLMELGFWDEANIEKLRLEEKQRQKRKERNVASEEASENGKGKEFSRGIPNEEFVIGVLICRRLDNAVLPTGVVL